MAAVQEAPEDHHHHLEPPENREDQEVPVGHHRPVHRADRAIPAELVGHHQPDRLRTTCQGLPDLNFPSFPGHRIVHRCLLQPPRSEPPLHC